MRLLKSVIMVTMGKLSIKGTFILLGSNNIHIDFVDLQYLFLEFLFSQLYQVSRAPQIMVNLYKGAI